MAERPRQRARFSKSDGLVEYDSYAAAFEDSSPRTIELVPWVRSQLANIDDPTREELRRAEARRRRWSAFFSLAALTALTVAWLETGSKDGLMLTAFFTGLCVGVPILWFLPQMRPVEIRGHVVQLRGSDHD